MTTNEFPEILRVAEEDRIACGPRALQRRADAGELVRVRTGAYVEASAWHAQSFERKELLRIAAVLGVRRTGGILFGESAALVVGLPLIGRGGGRVHLLSGTHAAPPNGRDIVWHRDTVPSASIIEVDGFLVTDVERTVLDLARRVPFLNVMPALDRGIRQELSLPGIGYDDGGLVSVDRRSLDGARPERLSEALDRMRGQRGVALARRSIEFADDRSESPGESLSRAQIHVLGFPPPELQVEFARDDGGVDRVDFDWPEYGICGEFDGKVKYFREEMLGDLTPNEVVWNERRRERRLKRGHGREMARWIWSDTMGAADGLREELLAAGVSRVRR